MKPKVVMSLVACGGSLLLLGLYQVIQRPGGNRSDRYVVTDYDAGLAQSRELTVADAMELNSILQRCLDSGDRVRMPSFESYRPRFVLESPTLQINFLENKVVIMQRRSDKQNWLQFVSDKEQAWLKAEARIREWYTAP